MVGNLVYAYDAAGLRTTAGGSLAATGLPLAVTQTNYNANNQLTTWGTANLFYDANGNMTSDGTNGYTWDTRNQLASMNLGAVSFQYDPFGRRAAKTIGGTTTNFLYDGANVAQELSGATPTANLLSGGIDQVFQRTDSAGARSFLTDALGSTLALTDSSGTLQTQYTYEPFGNTQVAGSASTNAFTYTGRELDAAGLYFYRARYFNPTFQRFISEDPLGFEGNSVNFYEYAYNSPENWIDPFGLQQLGIGIEPPDPSAISNGVLNVDVDPGHTFVYLRDSAGNITDLVSFGPGEQIGFFNKNTFKNGNLPGKMGWPLSGQVSTYQWPLSPAQYAHCKTILDAAKSQPGKYTPGRQCTSVSISLAQQCGPKVPNGISSVKSAIGSGSYPNPYGLMRQLNQASMTPTVVLASQFPH